MANDINISPEMINNLMNMLKSSNNSNSETDNTKSSNSSEESSNFSSVDFESIMKIKSIMETLNTKNDPRSNLIYSLKPYLRKSKQAKLDQYINLLKISQVSEFFKNDKGDSK